MPTVRDHRVRASRCPMRRRPRAARTADRPRSRTRECRGLEPVVRMAGRPVRQASPRPRSVEPGPVRRSGCLASRASATHQRHAERSAASTRVDRDAANGWSVDSNEPAFGRKSRARQHPNLDADLDHGRAGSCASREGDTRRPAVQKAANARAHGSRRHQHLEGDRHDRNEQTRNLTAGVFQRETVLETGPTGIAASGLARGLATGS